MRRFFEILATSFRMAIEEFRSNKLRTFLSLFGITIGIFCIIGVLATVNSLERNVQNDIKSLGNNTVFVDKWDYSNQIPWWNLPTGHTPKLSEMRMLEKAVPNAKSVAMSNPQSKRQS
jgi:putative ABC transport system permease protein